MTVVSPMIEPNTDAMKSHLSALFGFAQTEYPGGLIELRYGPPEHLDNWAYFNLQERGIIDAIAFASSRNRQGENVYVGVNPRKPNTSTKRAASADDVEIAFFHFADIDKAESVVGLVERYGALPPTMNHTTGTVPNKRPHLYWQLDEPVGNMAEWSLRQKGIAQSLGGDSVIDPPRIMRLAGTVNYPTQKKMAKGYKVELTTLRTEFANERSPVTPEQIAAAYPFKAEEAVLRPVEGQNTLTAMSPGGKTRRLIEGALSGNNWHDNVRDLTSRLARLGRTTDEILLMAPGLTLPGYSVDQTVADMRKMLDGARTKYGIPEPEDVDEPASSVDDDGFLPFEWFDEIDPQLNANWLVEDLIPAQGLALVYGHPGSGKSFFALDMAMHVAMAAQWRERPVTSGLVIYIGAEGQRGLRQRIQAFKQHHRIDELPFVLIPVEVNLLSSKEDLAAVLATVRHCAARFNIPIAMLVIDTLSRTFGGGDEVGTDMAAYVNNVGALQRELKCSAMVIHHRPKDSTNETPRGHGSLWGACDTILLVEDLGNIKQVKNTKQKDAELSTSILFTLKVIELGEDEKGKPVTSCVVAASDTGIVPSNPKHKLSAGQKITLEQLGLALETDGISVPESIPQNALNRVRIGKVVSVEKWQARTGASLSGPDTTPDSIARMFRRNRNRLQELDIIGVYGDFAWLQHKDADRSGQVRTGQFGQVADRRTGPDTPL